MAATVGEAYVTIKPETKGIGAELEKGLNEGTKGVGNVAGQAMGTAIGMGIYNAAKNGLSKLAGLMKSSVMEGADLEQQLGGAEAVFGKHSTELVNYSKDAFHKMGLSQNEYLQGANKIGSLVKASGIEGAQGIKYSNDMMQRASDIASIMGIDTTAALDAVTGAAKGNYTMMDNLGVKMDATSLSAYAMEKGYDKSFKAMTQAEKAMVSYDMFMEQSAHATGNYAKENDTLSGSLNTVKTGFKTLLGQLGQGEDVTKTLDGLKEPMKNFATSVVESIKNIAPQVSGIMKELAPIISSAVSELAPVVIPAFIDIVGQIASGLVEALPSIAAGLGEAFLNLDLGTQLGLGILVGFKAFGLAGKLSPLIGTALSAIKIPALPAGGGAGFSGFMTGLANGIMAFANPQILLGAAIIAGSMVILSAGVWASVKIVSDSLPGLGTALAGFNTINGANLLVVGGGLIALGAGLAAITAGAVINGLASFVGADFGSALKAIIEPIAQLMPTLTPEAIGKFSLLGTGLAALGLGYATIKGFTNGSAIASSITTLNTAVIAVGDGTAYATVSNGLVTLGNGITKLSSIKINVAGVASQLTSMTNKIKTLNNFNWSAATSKVKTNGQSIGKNVIQGIVSGINSEAYQLDISISNKIDQMVATAVKKAKIHSPSRLFRDEVGYWMGAALPVGFEDGVDDYSSIIPKSIDNMKSSVSKYDTQSSSSHASSFPTTFKIVESNFEMIVKAVVNEIITRNNVDYGLIK